MGSDPPIELSEHARQQIGYRGCTEADVEQAIRTCRWEPAELGRLECHLKLSFQREWNGRRYETQTVRPVFVREKGRIVVVTVYVYYG